MSLSYSVQQEVIRTVYQLSYYQFSSLHSLSFVRLFGTPRTAASQASLSITNSQSLLRLMSVESVMPSNHLLPCHLLLFCPQSFPISRSFPVSQLFTWGGQRIGTSTSNQSFQWIFRVDFLYDWQVWSSCGPWDSQESSAAPQFETINSSSLGLQVSAKYKWWWLTLSL